MALTVARKLNVADFQSWVEKELNGYSDINEVPEYRTVVGQPVAFNRLRGWEHIMTHLLDPEVTEKISTFHINYPISEIEFDLRRDKQPGSYLITYPKAEEAALMNALNYPAKPAVLVTESKFQGILDAVRTIVLEWSLKLEEAGILGSDMTFSESEKTKASSVIQNINNFINQISHSQISQGEITMRDLYTTGQAGAIGPNAHAHDMTFNQIWNYMQSSVDLSQLANELTRLRQEMKKEAIEPEQDIAVSEIAKAEQAAKSGYGAKTLGHLKSAGKWAFDVATKIGTSLAAKAIKKSMEP